MRHGSLLVLTLALTMSVAACKKAAPPPPRTPQPTPTAVPDKDILGFVRGGSVYAMRYDGSEARVLARPKQGQSLWFPVPSPAGDHLLAWLSRSDGTQDLVRIDLSGRITVLTEIGARAKPLMKSLRLGNAPSYSPDGKRIAYSFNGDLWLMDANGYNAETFIADGASWAPVISPDGKHLAYVNGLDGHFDVWMADLESRDTWQVTDFAEFTVGHPRWNKEGTALLVTRSQGEESDVVIFTLPKDNGTVSDGDPLTRDHVSAAAAWAPGNMHLIFSSARESAGIWTIYSSDTLGGSPKQLTKDSSFSPFWLRPGTITASVFDSGPSRPTPAPAVAAATAIPTAIPAAPTAVPAAVASKPASPATAPPSAPTAVATTPDKPTNPAAAPAKPTAVPSTAVVPAAKPNAPVAVAPTKPGAPTAAPATVPQAAAAPTQPPAKAAPLRLRLKATFDDGAKLAPAGLAELKKLAPRVAQYAGETVTVIGPQDRSPLKGKFATEEARSKARATAIAEELTKQGKLKAGAAKAQPYAPPAAGASGPPNSIQIYVELK